MAMNFIAQSMRRFGLAPDNKKDPTTISPTDAINNNDPIGHLKIGSPWAFLLLNIPLIFNQDQILGII